MSGNNYYLSERMESLLHHLLFEHMRKQNLHRGYCTRCGRESTEPVMGFLKKTEVSLSMLDFCRYCDGKKFLEKIENKKYSHSLSEG